jgi:hypothetical protein
MPLYDSAHAVNDKGSCTPALLTKHGLPPITIIDISEYRIEFEVRLEAVSPISTVTVKERIHQMEYNKLNKTICSGCLAGWWGGGGQRPPGGPWGHVTGERGGQGSPVGPWGHVTCGRGGQGSPVGPWGAGGR